MILQALTQYYYRLKDEGAKIAPFGFEKKEIPFLIVLDKDGNFKGLRDTRAGDGKKKRARSFLLPKGEKKTSGIKANLLWDNPQYIFGVSKGNSDKDERRAQQAKKAFLAKIIKVFGEDFDDDGIRAVIRFLNREDFDQVYKNPLWKEIAETHPNMTFILEGDHQELIAQRPKVVARLETMEISNGKERICLVTGKKDAPAILHTAIKGVWGAQSSGANIVSFNKESFCSFTYWKKQGLNAPVGQRTEFAYTTALNTLLAKDSRQRMQVGDTSTVFWADKSHPFEEDFSFFLSEPPKGQEPDYSRVRALLKAVQTGTLPPEDTTGFHVLGLAPNASRIAIRFWYDGTVAELKARIAQHFQDLEIVRSPGDREYLSLFQILIAIAPEGKSDNIPPNLGGETMRSVLSGLPYPRTLLSAAISRCKAEQKVNRTRAAIIKACLVRQARFQKKSSKEVSMALDKTYDNMGYVLGRLFAVFERIQEKALGGGLNKTIRDTYFGAASSSPLVTFRRLNELAIHHLAKLRNSGESTTWLEMLLQEVMDKVPASGIPNTMSLDDQGRFAVGYYHQRQDFFRFNKNKEEDKEVAQ